MRAAALGRVALLVVLVGFPVLLAFATPAPHSVTVTTDKSSYVGDTTVFVSGVVTPPARGTVTLVTKNKGATAVDIGHANVNPVSGTFSYDLVAAGNKEWIPGAFFVTAIWENVTATARTTFTWAQAAYSMALETDRPAYQAGDEVVIFGSIMPAPGVPSDVLLTTTNPVGATVEAVSVPVDPVSGAFNSTLVTGATLSWTPGRYTLTASWELQGASVNATARFTYD